MHRAAPHCLAQRASEAGRRSQVAAPCPATRALLDSALIAGQLHCRNRCVVTMPHLCSLFAIRSLRSKLIPDSARVNLRRPLLNDSFVLESLRRRLGLLLPCDIPAGELVEADALLSQRSIISAGAAEAPIFVLSPCALQTQAQLASSQLLLWLRNQLGQSSRKGCIS